MSRFNNTRLYENILGPSTNPNNLDIYNEFVDEEDNEKYDTQLFNFGDTTVPSSSYDMAGVNTPFAQQAPEEFVSQFLPETDIYNQQTTRYQKRPEQVETDIFFRPQLQPEYKYVDAKTDNRTLLEKLLNPDLDIDEAIDKEEQKRKREQELLQLIQNA